MLTFDGPKIADAAADIGADALGYVVIYFQDAIVHRFLRSSDSVLDESAHLAGVLLFDIVQRIEVIDFASELNRELFGVEFFNVIRATAAFHERGPGCLDRITHGRNQAETSNDDATTQIKT